MSFPRRGTPWLSSLLTPPPPSKAAAAAAGGRAGRHTRIPSLFVFLSKQLSLSSFFLLMSFPLLPNRNSMAELRTGVGWTPDWTKVWRTPDLARMLGPPLRARYIRLNSCMHRVPTDPSERGTRWPAEWPRRVRTPPYWLNTSQAGVYGKPAPEDFAVDYEHWRRVMDKSYLNGLGIDWSRVRNVMDMRAAYGGFAAALRDQKIWVMNVVNVDAPDTLPIIFERGLFGIYHDWCESFSTYPRTYDLLHADHLFSKIKERCAVLPVVVEVDRIVRPGGSIIVRDESGAVGKVEKLLRSLHWDVRLTFSKNNEGVLCAEKSNWRPEMLAEPS